jgi:flagellar biosynthesis/type III secretory pathway M-ring protein FliF/YscJ
LKAIHDLAAAAVGMDMTRGDQLIVESLPFESTLNLESPEVPVASPAAPAAPMSLETLKKNPKITGGVAAGVIALLGGAGFLMMRMRRKKAAPASVRVEQEAVLPSSGGGEQRGLPESVVDTWHSSADSKMNLPALATPRADVLANQVREVMARDAEICVGVLRGWLREEQG